MTSTSVNRQGSRTPLSERRRHTEGTGAGQSLPSLPTYMLPEETPSMFVYIFGTKHLLFFGFRVIYTHAKGKQTKEGNDYEDQILPERQEDHP